MNMLAELISKFPAGFTFGVATSSYQIEGTDFGGCGRSHWDQFAEHPGRTYLGQNGSIACDHYHRWAEDLDLVHSAGFDAYRFSFSWPRLLPESDHKVNPDGVAFYDRLIDGMLERGLRPFATLYHWDLPSRLAEQGGWTVRETPLRFADYTDLIMRHFGDRLETVAPVNEPWCVSWLSHYWGAHAPGLRDLSATANSMHFIQLAHGLSVQVMRGHGHKNIGCVLNKEWGEPADNTPETLRLTALFDGIYNRWFEESIFKGCYPDDVMAVLARYLPSDYHADMDIISQPLDWVGVNYYTRSLITPDASEPHFGFACIRGDLPKTDMGWEIDPKGLSFFLKRLASDYAPGLPIYITENGMANADSLNQGKIEDTARISYFSSHLTEVAKLVAQGCPVKGYFAWSLLDNFEWAFGYDKRFGLVYVDYNTLNRIPKDSYQAWKSGLSGR